MINEKLIKELLGEEELTAREILERGDFIEQNLSIMKLVSVLKKMEDIEIVCNYQPSIYGGPRRVANSYRVVEKMSFTGKVEKEKNLLKMELDNNDFIIYDFNKHDFISNKKPNSRIKNQDKNIILKIFCNQNYSQIQDTEWLYSYVDLLDNDLSNYKNFDFKKCPNGYINWLKETNFKINTYTLTLYNYLKKYPKVPIPIINEFLDKNTYYPTRDLNFLKTLNTLYDKCNLERIFKNCIKNCEFNIERNLLDLIGFIDNYYSKQDWSTYIDNNRTLKDNLQTLQILYEEQKNSMLSSNLQKLNFLNNTKIDDFIIIVPQNVKDLMEEGKQQNNCVGHYYNDSINRGQNLIYFIRNFNTPTKSFITCRYNLHSQTTTEHRLKNNCSTTREQEQLIEKIDKIINEYFKKEV